jgi:ATP-dependent DNA ligase
MGTGAKVTYSFFVRHSAGEPHSRSLYILLAQMPSSLAKKMGSLPARAAVYMEPMECLAVAKLPDGAQWLYEIKWDGYRAEAITQMESWCCSLAAANPSTDNFR